MEERYSRHQGLSPSFQQQQLCDAVVLIVGMGGLGTHVADNLARAGVGTLIFCDHDTISLSNLNRQLFYTIDDLQQPKVNIAERELRRINHEVNLLAFAEKFHSKIFQEIPRPQLIIDCVDNFSSRKELIEYAKEHTIPLIHGAVDGFSGQVSTYLPSKSACPLCILSHNIEESESPSPPSLGCCVATIAGLQATEAIKFFTKSGKLCLNTILFYDALSLQFESISMDCDPQCIACSEHRK